jgi:hypothetical protein
MAGWIPSQDGTPRPSGNSVSSATLTKHSDTLITGQLKFPWLLTLTLRAYGYLQQAAWKVGTSVST